MSQSADDLNNDADLQVLACAIRDLAPIAPSFPRDRLLFEAGKASLFRALWWWKRGTIVATLAVVGMAVAWWWIPREPQVIERERVVELRVPRR